MLFPIIENRKLCREQDEPCASSDPIVQEIQKQTADICMQ